MSRQRQMPGLRVLLGIFVLVLLQTGGANAQPTNISCPSDPLVANGESFIIDPTNRTCEHSNEGVENASGDRLFIGFGPQEETDLPGQLIPRIRHVVSSSAFEFTASELFQQNIDLKNAETKFALYGSDRSIYVTVMDFSSATLLADFWLELKIGFDEGYALRAEISIPDGINFYGEAADTTAPSGYSVKIDQDWINADNQNEVSFSFADAEIGADYEYSFTSGGGGTAVTGDGTISTATDKVSDIDLSGLVDGTVSLSVTLTDDDSNRGETAKYQVVKDTEAPTFSVKRDNESPTNATKVAFSVDFSQDVESVDGADFKILVTDTVSANNFAIDNASEGNLAQYTVTVDGIAGDGSLAIALTELQNITDLAGNPVDTNPTENQIYEFDNTPPNIVLGNNGPLPAGSTAKLISAGTTDSGSGIDSYKWEQVADAEGNAAQIPVAITLVTPDAHETSFAIPSGAQPGDKYFFKLVVTDKLGNSSFGVTTFEVSASEEEVVGDVPGDAQPASIDDFPDLAASTITASPSAIEADGASTSTISVQLKKNDNTDFISDGGTVVLVTDLGSFSSGATPQQVIATYQGSGNYTAVLTSTTSVGTAEIIATLDGVELENKAMVVFEDSTIPTVEILDAPETIEDLAPFAVRVVFSEEMKGFELADLLVNNGSVSALSSLDNASFNLEVSPDGWGNVTLQVPAGVAEDLNGNGNHAAKQVIINFRNAEATRRIIANFMHNRASFMLGNQPDLSRMLHGTHGDGGGTLGYLGLTGNKFGMDLAFATSLSKTDRERQKAISKMSDGFQAAPDEVSALPFSAKHAVFGGPMPDDFATSDQLPTRRYDIWTELYGATSSSGDNNSSYWIGYLGGHYFVSDDLLLGGLMQLDWSEEEDSVAGSTANGTGWMLGAYMAGNVPHTDAYWDLRAAWGRSTNNVAPLGTYKDEFDTQRWLVSGQVQGSFAYDAIFIKPGLQGSWFQETQQSYVDSLGGEIAKQTISLGELKFGPEFSTKRVLDNGLELSPAVGIAGVWNFNVGGNQSAQIHAPGDDEIRARVDLKLNMADLKGRSLALSGYYDGLGVDNYEAMGGEVRLSIPFQ